MNVFESVSLPLFVVAFLIGIFWGFVLHAIVRAPRWLVERLSE